MRQNRDFRRGFQVHFAVMGFIAAVCVIALTIAFLEFY
jgi:hypothetical protein